MRPSRPFLLIVVFLLLLGGGSYYFVTKNNIFDRVSAENLSPLDTYLSENFFFTLGLPKKTEEAIRVYCDQIPTAQTDESIAFGYPCQNQNPAHKVVIGWANSSEKYMDTATTLANDQIFWRNYPSPRTENGALSCKERVDYPYYRDATFGMDCVNKTEDGQKLYSSILFIQPKNLTNKKVFIAVLNTSKITSVQEVETEFLAIIAQRKFTPNKFSFREIFGSAPSFSSSEAGDASSTSRFSDEGSRSGSRSDNIITKDSGNGIDATVCDAIDTTSCYPVYCNSLTAVFNYSLNKCIEPAGGTSISGVAAGGIPISSAKNCPAELPVWDGSKCRALTGNIILNNSCLIPIGKDSCDMNIIWSTQATKGDVEVRLPLTETVVLTTGVSGTLSHTFSYQDTPYIVQIYDMTGKLNDGRFTTKCISGGFDMLLKKCVDPEVSRLTITGDYYTTPGVMKIICSNADAYVVRNTDTGMVLASSSYVGKEIEIPIMKTGNYTAICSQGNYESAPSVRYYNAPPPPASEIFFLISPRTLVKNQKTVLNWTIHFPAKACKLSATSVCKDKGECTPSQVESENTVNEIFATESTDENDPETSRPIKDAVSQVAASQIDKDWKAVGQKTIALHETTDFLLDCGEGVHEKKRVYVRTITQTTNDQ